MILGVDDQPRQAINPDRCCRIIGFCFSPWIISGPHHQPQFVGFVDSRRTNGSVPEGTFAFSYSSRKAQRTVQTSQTWTFSQMNEMPKPGWTTTLVCGTQGLQPELIIPVKQKSREKKKIPQWRKMEGTVDTRSSDCQRVIGRLDSSCIERRNIAACCFFRAWRVEFTLTSLSESGCVSIA
ncbi:hypothetical protein BO82DRAFT_62430 [Aspergillus uvarum CBS 121591]|uniref:Uncharacterized protein n=1 Tax=Aspergillus uvarum CBS 121591 TaxID=1448315 RepID=A0A319CFJ3_9EURO|nr:hypothetical protein BO82DRAFT_62430 [Aspergillus uvarum CBS 121591]PYH82481.1 hypothetical protein BO82DRAFT_62430 [Aspergillus uvarum CBS 121591]